MKAAKRIDQVDLRSPVRMALQIWLNGEEVATMIPRRTFYKYRSEILKAVGVDISMNAADQLEGNSDAMFSIEELERREVVSIPDRIQRSLFGSQL